MPGVEVAADRRVAYGALVDPERTSEDRVVRHRGDRRAAQPPGEDPHRPGPPLLERHGQHGRLRSGRLRQDGFRGDRQPGRQSGRQFCRQFTEATTAATGAATGAVTGVEAAAEPTRATRTRPVERRTTELREARPTPVPEPRTGTEYRAGEIPAAEPKVPTNIYRARRPAVAVLLIIPAIGVGLLLLRALAISAFGDNPFNIGGVIASACALAALPLLVAGLYGLVTGAAHGAEQYGFKVWARPPLAYLLVSLSLIASAALAIRAS